MAAESPVVLVKWYDVVKWFLERVDSFPKNQRFVFGQRLADRAIDVLELLVEAAYSPRKADLLSRANRDIEVLRGWCGWPRTEGCSRCGSMASPARA